MCESNTKSTYCCDKISKRCEFDTEWGFPFAQKQLRVAFKRAMDMVNMHVYCCLLYVYNRLWLPDNWQVIFSLWLMKQLGWCSVSLSVLRMLLKLKDISSQFWSVLLCPNLTAVCQQKVVPICNVLTLFFSSLLKPHRSHAVLSYHNNHLLFQLFTLATSWADTISCNRMYTASCVFCSPIQT